MRTFKSAETEIDSKSAETVIINYLSINANRMLFSMQLGHAGQYSVVIDSYQVPRAAEAWPWSAIIIVCFKYFSLQLSCPNK